MHFKKLKWPEVKALDFDRLIAIAPLGSIEQHSLHLPLSVDTDLVTELSERVEAARPETIVLLPTLWLGHSPHHRHLASLSLDIQPYMEVIKGLCDSLIRTGFRKILFLNGHGGNEIVTKAAMRDVKTKFEDRPDLRIGFASYWALGRETVSEVARRGWPRLRDGNLDDAETAARISRDGEGAHRWTVWHDQQVQTPRRSVCFTGLLCG